MSPEEKHEDDIKIAWTALGTAQDAGIEEDARAAESELIRLGVQIAADPADEADPVDEAAQLDELVEEPHMQLPDM